MTELIILYVIGCVIELKTMIVGRYGAVDVGIVNDNAFSFSEKHLVLMLRTVIMSLVEFLL